VTLLLLPLALRAGAFRSPSLVRQTVVGALALGGYLAGTVKAIELGVPAGLAALIGALQPLVTATIAGPLLGERVVLRQWVGLLVGLGGVALALGGTLRLGAAPSYACLLPFLGTLAWVGATLMQKGRPEDDMPILASLCVQSAAAVVIFAVLAAVEGRLAPIPSAGFAASVLWFVAFSTLGGYGLYWACLRRTSATRVSSLIYLTPPVTMVWAWLMFGETLPGMAWVGLVISLGGVVVAVRPAHPEVPRSNLPYLTESSSARASAWPRVARSGNEGLTFSPHDHRTWSMGSWECVPRKPRQGGQTPTVAWTSRGVMVGTDGWRTVNAPRSPRARPGDTVVGKADRPFADGAVGDAELAGNRPARPPGGGQQHDLGALRQALLTARRPHPALEQRSLVCHQRDWRRLLTHLRQLALARRPERRRLPRVRGGSW
jgi:drug/metabolite transporter (DMT)-like permease